MTGLYYSIESSFVIVSSTTNEATMDPNKQPLAEDEKQGDLLDTADAESQQQPDLLDTPNEPAEPQPLAEDEKQGDLLDSTDDATAPVEPAEPQPLAEDEKQGDLLDTNTVGDETAEVDPEADPLEAQPLDDDEKQGDLLDSTDDPTVDPDADPEAADRAVPMAPGDGDDDDDIEDFSTPFEDGGDFEDKKDEDDVELFDDEEDPDAEQKEPLTKKKKRGLRGWKKKTYTEKEPSKAEKRRRRRACCLLFCCCLIIIILIILLIWWLLRDKEDPSETPVADDDADDGFVDDFFGFGDGLVGDDVQTTPFDPYVKNDCDFSDNFQPHVINQCECYGKVTVMADDIRELYTLLKTKLMPELYTEEGTLWDVPITSCDPRNQALLWLSSGDTRRAGDLVQRFLTSTAYIAMNGTMWDYQNLWLSEQNECLWLGLQCNSRFQIHSLALDTINIFGTVRCSLVDKCMLGFVVFALF